MKFKFELLKFELLKFIATGIKTSRGSNEAEHAQQI